MVIEHIILGVSSRIDTLRVIVKYELFMNGPSHMEGGQVYYGELVL